MRNAGLDELQLETRLSGEISTTSDMRMIPSWCCFQYVSKSGRLSSSHRTGKGQFSSQFPRRVVLKNVPTTGRLYSSLMLIGSCLKSCMLGFIIMQTRNFQMSKLGYQRSSCQHSLDHREIKGIPEKHLPLFH